MLDRSRLISSFAPQQLILVSVLWGEVSCSSWGERGSQAASQGPGAWTAGSPGSEITLSLLLLLDKRALPFSAAAQRSLSPELGSPAGRDEHAPPAPQPSSVILLWPCPEFAGMSSEFISRLVPCQLQSRS